MAVDRWKKRLQACRREERPEAVLVVAGQGELIRIVTAWMQTNVKRAKRLTTLRGESDADVWAWLWHNARYNKAELLTRIPNATPKTTRNFDALVANRVLYPDGTVNSFVERYLKQRVIALLTSPRSKRSRDAA